MTRSPLPRVRALLALLLTAVVAVPAAVHGAPPAAGATGPVATTVSLRIGPGSGPAPVCAEVRAFVEVRAADRTVHPPGAVTLMRDGVPVATTLPDSIGFLDVTTGCAEGTTETWTAAFTDDSGAYASSTSAPVVLELVRRTQTISVTAPPVTWSQRPVVTARITGSAPWAAARQGTIVLRRDGVEFARVPGGSISDESVRLPLLEPGRYEITAQLLEDGTTYASEPLSTTLVVGPVRGTFHAIAPRRLQDTRRPYPDFCDRDCVYRPLDPGGSVWVYVNRDWTGSTGNVLPDDATAVALNVTTTQAEGPGWIAVHAGDRDVPVASTGNLWPGQDVATMTIAKAGTAGWVEVHSSNRTHVAADAVGYWTDDTSGAYVQALAPTRVLDTRGGARVGATDRTVQVVGRTDVPASATAVVVNVTSTQSAGRGYVTAVAAGTEPDRTSALNLVPGTDRSNLAIVALGADGAIALRSPVSPTHLVADVVGYMSPERGSTTGPLPPRRLLDTRVAEGRARAGDLVLPVAGREGVPQDAAAVWLSVTTTQAAGLGHVVVWPGGPVPIASTSNLVPGQDVAALTLVPVGADGTVTVRRSTATHVVVDVVGSVDAAR